MKILKRKASGISRRNWMIFKQLSQVNFERSLRSFKAYLHLFIVASEKLKIMFEPVFLYREKINHTRSAIEQNERYRHVLSLPANLKSLISLVCICVVDIVTNLSFDEMDSLIMLAS